VGEYRILYRIDDKAREIRIFQIGHRREVYR
jgi:mRNA-degrading endonuclease RelE of RelBE toxin-antitoxin system